MDHYIHTDFDLGCMTAYMASLFVSGQYEHTFFNLVFLLQTRNSQTGNTLGRIHTYMRIATSFVANEVLFKKKIPVVRTSNTYSKHNGATCIASMMAVLMHLHSALKSRITCTK